MTRGIKGLLPEVSAIATGELKDLGIQQVVYNLYLDEVCAAPGDSGTVSSDDNGQTYYFSNGRVTHYDQMIRGFNEQGIQVTMVLLNRGGTEGSQDLVHPLARGGAECPSYALNVEEDGGVQHLKAAPFWDSGIPGRPDMVRLITGFWAMRSMPGPPGGIWTPRLWM